jgi:hypothetical protein
VFLLKGKQLGKAIFAVAALSVLDRGFERGCGPKQSSVRFLVLPCARKDSRT